MSEITGISNVSNNLENSFFNHILVCKCGKIDEFSVIFKKELMFSFLCMDEEYKLNELNKAQNISQKCRDCKQEIIITDDFCKMNNQNIFFFCKNCKKQKKNKNNDLIKISNVIYKEDEADSNRRNIIMNKINNFINNNNKSDKDEFYNMNLINIELFKQFIDYLFLLRNLYIKNDRAKNIISNFLDYYEKLIDVASQNILIYDLYHFNKETIVYGYFYKNNIRFFSKKFRIKYKSLLFKCKKKRYLSLEMLKYINENYVLEKLSDRDETLWMKIKYFQEENIDIKRIIFPTVAQISFDYLHIQKAFSELEHRLETIELKVKITKLEDELNLDKYLDSFLQIPGKFSLFRKSASLILDRIIRKNHEKLRFIQPSEKIIIMTLQVINKMRNQLNKFKKPKKEKTKNIANSIINKLNNLVNILNNYKNKKIASSPIKELNFPLINLEESEKTFLKENIKEEKFSKYSNKISVSEGEDKNLDFIINYFFELKDKTSKIIHINDEENLKFFSFSKQINDLPSHNEEDDYKIAIQKIKQIIEMTPKYDQITYAQLISFLFDTKKNKNFLVLDDKIDYLLKFLNLEINKLSIIGTKFQKIKNKIEGETDGISEMLQNVILNSDKKKYDNFIKKYKIKVNLNPISDYLNNLVKYAMPKRKKLIYYSDSEENEENEEENDAKVEEEKEDEREDPFDRRKKFEKKESELRNKIKELFEKDKKFISYIPFYLWGKLGSFIEENEEIFKNKLNFLQKKITEKNLLCLKLNKIHNIISAFKLYNFDIKNNFEEFILDNEEILPNKKIKTEEGNEANPGITSFKYFIENIKKYMGDINDKVELTGEEPNQFILNLFLEKIGLIWS